MSLSIKPNRIIRTVPDDILNDVLLNECIRKLPSNYNFEIHKSVWTIRKNKATKVALQFPEGLLMYSLVISDILEEFCGVETLVMGDVTYGACCIDDFTACSLECDFMLHYGHSCLVPVQNTKIRTMYVFVNIGIDLQHFVDMIKQNVDHGSSLALVSTIQFASSLQQAAHLMADCFDVLVPQSKPLSPGEILGCTAPRIAARDYIVYLGDGRFHLESMMIANPTISVLSYDPYSKRLTREQYNHSEMQQLRKTAIKKATSARKIGLILGTLGRQGSTSVLDYLQSQLRQRGISYVVLLLSEIFPAKLALFTDIDAWIQVACPRLSIDWGNAFQKPLLTPYEAAILFKAIEPWKDVYPMDFYSKHSLGPWTPNHSSHKV